MGACGPRRGVSCVRGPRGHRTCAASREQTHFSVRQQGKLAKGTQRDHRDFRGACPSPPSLSDFYASGGEEVNSIDYVFPSVPWSRAPFCKTNH